MVHDLMSAVTPVCVLLIAQAGNKSSLSYRSDNGIPGYTGYIPGFATVPIGTKGSTQHTGRVVDDDVKLQATLKAADNHKASEYANSYQPDLSAYKPLSKTGGGYWFEERSRQAAGNSPPFLATTTYKAEVIDADATARAQLNQSLNVSQTLVPYEVARSRRSQSTDPRLHTSTRPLSSTTVLVGTGDLLGYKSQYKSMTSAMSTKLAADTARRPASALESFSTARFQNMPRAGAPRFEAGSSYTRDFGELGADPMSHCAASGSEMTLSATTRPLNEGTSRACHQIPGYTGFIPASHMNAVAQQQGEGLLTRTDLKADMLLNTLDQYSRTRVPGYTGYKPRAGPGATALQPAHGATKETTQGFINAEVLKRGPQPVESAHHINSRKGIMNFFTGGGASISDNGEADAQKFYVRQRPLEGRMHTYHASSTNMSGARFDPKNSIVPA
eukprot:jgi/Chrzof1/47/Cz01g01170.t1